MTQQLAGALPGRDIHVAADSAYAGEELSKLGSQVTWTTRLRKDAALHRPPPARTGRRGRPRVNGGRLPSLAGLAATAKFTPVTVTRYGKAATIQAATRACRPGPQPHRERGPPHRALPARLPDPGHDLVRGRRP